MVKIVNFGKKTNICETPRKVHLYDMVKIDHFFRHRGGEGTFKACMLLITLIVLRF